MPRTPSSAGLGAVALLAFLSVPAVASTRYVDAGLATGANDGTSWADAYRGVDALKVALTAAVAGDELWVRAGTYKPTTTATRTIFFDLKTGVAVYGGFAGGETLLAERDHVANPTILSGDLAGNDGSGIFTDNSHHVVNGASASATAILDGFTLQGGNANGAGGNLDKGGGLLMMAASNATIRNCIVRNNRCTFGGGAGYVNSSSPVFEDCTFENNVGGSFGGAFDMATNVGAQFRRCIFRGNSAARAGGVEIFGASSPTLVNCLFTGNTATSTGGGGAILVLNSSNPTIRLCTIVGNASPATTGAGILVSGAAATVQNSIAFSNTGSGGSQSVANQISGATSVTYTCVQGGLAGTGNIATAPTFVNAGGGDFRLAPGSAGIDAGNNLNTLLALPFDLGLAARIADDPATADTGSGTPPIVDMGAHEYQPPLFRSFCAGDGVDPDVTTPCPCANAGGAGRGCANSVEPLGGRLVATGTAAADDVVLFGDGMPATVACIYLQGDALEDAPFGDGVRCAGGTLVRLRTKINAGGASQFPDGTDTVTLSQRGGVAPGSGAVRHYQTYYRNAAAAFCPPETFNVTNGWSLAW
jgi:hypothetical protein